MKSLKNYANKQLIVIPDTLYHVCDVIVLLAVIIAIFVGIPLVIGG